jgi:hypothetical protein
MNQILAAALSLGVSITVIGIFVSVSAETRPMCVLTEDDREHVRSVAVAAIDVALKEQIQHLFDVWMRDGSDQPKRAVTGFNNAVRAYNGARAAVMNWQPPICSVRGRTDDNR